MKRVLNKFAVVALVGIAVAACAAPEPYIDRPYAIDRESADFPFGPKLEPESEIRVCYSSRNTTPADVRAVAETECGTVGLSAFFEEQALHLCPLTAPNAAIFTCNVASASDEFRSPPGPATTSAPINTNAASAPTAATSGLSPEDVSTTAKSDPFPTFLFGAPSPN